MKLKKIKWKLHPILGDLELDLSNSKDEPFETILLVGENGTGKTTIFEKISTFISDHRGYSNFHDFEYIEYEKGGETFKIVPRKNDLTNLAMFDVFDIHNQKVQKFEFFNGCVYSKARADYKTQVIRSTTTKQLDTEKFNVDKNEDYTSLKQLIVDIESQDKSSYAEQSMTSGQNPPSWDSFYVYSKIYRFKNAFDNFFDKIKYNKVVIDNGEHKILFSKNNTLIPIDQLSTGEKQIVFRGAYILKDIKVLNDTIVFIDEPELSMHPKWQKEILKYYKDLLTENNIQKTQLFIATHSEHILSEALKDQNKNLIIILTENKGIIESKHLNQIDSVLPSITSAETNYLAFNIVSNDYHIELYGWLQEKEGLHAVTSCDNFILNHPNYNRTKHSKDSEYTNHSGHKSKYSTLSTYIRNTIDHPDTSKLYSESELRTSIELLREILAKKVS